MSLLVRRIPALALLAAALGLCAPAVRANCPANNAAGYADEIAHGHAYHKHVVNEGQFRNGEVVNGLAFPDASITTKDAFEAFILSILNNTATNRALANQRHAYWDGRTGTVVIVNRRAGDCGTAFRPTNGMAYYNGLN